MTSNQRKLDLTGPLPTALDPDIDKVTLRICSRCIYDERVRGITFDADGVCQFCRQVEKLRAEYGTGTPAGEERLIKIFDEIKAAGRGKPYDCVVGVSGGTDSSYTLYKAKEYGLRPLAVHYDNTWNTAIATQNIRKMLEGLDVDLFTYVIDNKEADDLFRATFLAGVADLDATTDLALAEVLYRAAAKYRVQYILEGHSFVTEGISPVGLNYFDGQFIRSIHRQFGRRPMRTYPLMTFSRLLYWASVARIRRIRPLWYLDYTKEDAQQFLTSKFGWENYGGHHLENRIAVFGHSVYLPRKCNADLRNNSLSARVRLGAITRKEAWALYNTPPRVEEGVVKYFMKRTDVTREEFERVMTSPVVHWSNYKTYKRRFELMRPVFAAMAKANMIPMSMYLKYCFPMPQVKP